MKQTAMKPLAFAAIAAAMMVAGTTLQAADTDDKIEESFKKSYVYQTVQEPVKKYGPAPLFAGCGIPPQPAAAPDRGRVRGVWRWKPFCCFC